MPFLDLWNNEMVEDQNNKNPIVIEKKKMVKMQNPLFTEQAQENGGPKGLEPTRFGDWEKDGRCIDF